MAILKITDANFNNLQALWKTYGTNFVRCVRKAPDFAGDAEG
jgi:hypothetical protein